MPTIFLWPCVSHNTLDCHVPTRSGLATTDERERLLSKKLHFYYIYGMVQPIALFTLTRSLS